MVTKPQNVLIMRDVACAGYVAGGNASFFTKYDKTHTLERARTALQERLSFSDDVGAKYGSMLAFPCTEQQFSANQGLDTVMSVTSRLLPWEVTGVNARNHSSFPGGEQVFRQYNQMLGLDSVHYGEDMKAAENQDFISQGSTNNATCFLGPHRKFDPFTSNFMSLVPGQGHFGPDAIPGVSSSHIQTIALFPYTFTTQLQSRFRCAEQRIGLTCTKHTRGRTPAGAGARASRSRPRATAWSRSSWRSTRRWSTASARRAAPAAAAARAPAAAATGHPAFPLSPGFVAFALLLARLGRARRGSVARRLRSQLGWCVCACLVWALAHSVGVRA